MLRTDESKCTHCQPTKTNHPLAQNADSSFSLFTSHIPLRVDMVHASEAAASFQNRNHQSTADCSLLKPDQSLSDVMDVAAGKAN